MCVVLVICPVVEGVEKADAQNFAFALRYEISFFGFLCCSLKLTVSYVSRNSLVEHICLCCNSTVLLFSSFLFLPKLLSDKKLIKRKRNSCSLILQKYFYSINMKKARPRNTSIIWSACPRGCTGDCRIHRLLFLLRPSSTVPIFYILYIISEKQEADAIRKPEKEKGRIFSLKLEYYMCVCVCVCVCEPMRVLSACSLHPAHLFHFLSGFYWNTLIVYLIF